MDKHGEESRKRAAFWVEPQPLLLASKSEGRRLALFQAAIPFEVAPAEVDERAIEARVIRAGGDPDAVVLALSRAKALTISQAHPGRLVVGADQAGSLEGQIFGKPEDLPAAKRQLSTLSGRVHRLHSGFALARGDKVLFEAVAHADLTMRRLDEAFLDAYLAAAGDVAVKSAGAYQIEGLGAHLFEKIAGDHWTILGLPLIELLSALRGEGALLG
ncbi:MAG TPA: Maf family protein [Methylocystis sp.]|nr:Maf family protein [Methylocystis sp.]